jgi:hypothetical protein
VYKQILINKKIKNWKWISTELTERSPFRKLRSTLDCSTVPSKKKRRGGGGGEEEKEEKKMKRRRGGGRGEGEED